MAVYSTEIKVAADGGSAGASATRGWKEREKAGAAEVDPVVDVYSAAAYRDLKRMWSFVEEGGTAATLREPDSNGHRALQCAALNIYPHVALYLIVHRDQKLTS